MNRTAPMTALSHATPWPADSALRSRLLDHVRRRRIYAFLIDSFVVALLWFPAAALVLFLGILTLGAAWMLFPALWPAIALLYVGATVRGPRAGTPGMRAMGLVMRRIDGGEVDSSLAVLHALAFWVSIAFLTPAILLVSLVSGMKRTLHDAAAGIVIVNAR